MLSLSIPAFFYMLKSVFQLACEACYQLDFRGESQKPGSSRALGQTQFSALRSPTPVEPMRSPALALGLGSFSRSPHSVRARVRLLHVPSQDPTHPQAQASLAPAAGGGLSDFC